MRLNIYHTNDIHANFAFLGRVCAYLEEHRTESDLYLDSGDFLDLKSLVVQADRAEVLWHWRNFAVWTLWPWATTRSIWAVRTWKS